MTFQVFFHRKSLAAAGNATGVKLRIGDSLFSSALFSARSLFDSVFLPLNRNSAGSLSWAWCTGRRQVSSLLSDGC